MSNENHWLFKVNIRTLKPIPVAYKKLDVCLNTGQYNAEIGQTFTAVGNWVSNLVGATYQPRVIGLPTVMDDQLAYYTCCVEVPDTIQQGDDQIQITTLQGGKYAIVSIQKTPELIPKAIGQFFSEYVPAHQLEIDGSRPEYEIYYDDIVEQCIPVQ